MHSSLRLHPTGWAALTAAAVTVTALGTASPRIAVALILAATVWLWSSAVDRPSPLIPAWALVAYTIVEEQASAPGVHHEGRHELVALAAFALAWAIGDGRRRVSGPTRVVTRPPDGGSGRARSTAQTCRP